MEFIDLVIKFTNNYRDNIDSCADTNKLESEFKKQYKYEEIPFDANELYWAISSTLEQRRNLGHTDTLSNDEIRNIVKPVVASSPDVGFGKIYHKIIGPTPIDHKIYNRLTTKKIFYCCQEELAKYNLPILASLNVYIDVPDYIYKFVIDTLSNVTDESPNKSYWFIDCKWKVKTRLLCDLFIKANPEYNKSKHLQEMFNAVWRRLFGFTEKYEPIQPPLSDDDEDYYYGERHFDKEFGQHIFNSYCDYLKKVKHAHNEPLSKLIRKNTETRRIIINPFQIVKCPKRIKKAFKTLYPNITVEAELRTDVEHWFKLYLHNVSEELYPWRGEYNHSIIIL